MRKFLKKIPFLVYIVRYVRRITLPKTIKFKLNDTNYKVLNAPFWRNFSKGSWEDYTLNVYKKYIDKDTSYFDIGCWIGPTIIYANEAQAKNIFALEANPETYKIVKQNCELNHKSLPPYTLMNACVFNKDHETVNFGMSPERKGDTSCCSVRGSEFLVPTIKLQTIFKKNKDLLANKNFIKIDIEGFESEIIQDISDIKNIVKPLTIMLSLHPPFWENVAKTTDDILNLYNIYAIKDSNDSPLEKDKLKEMLLWQGKGRPEWSTHNGNFFEIILKEK